MTEPTPIDQVGRALDEAVPMGPLDAALVGDGGGGGRSRREDGLPEGCPVTPLGVVGDVFFYLDAVRQLRAVKGRDHSRLGVLVLFGRDKGFLYDAWGRKDKDGNTTGWRPEKVSEELISSCHRLGVWNPMSFVRGAGAWCGADGELVLHTGDAIWRNGKWWHPGPIDEYVYPAAPPTPKPSPDKSPGGDGGPGDEVLALLRTLHWRRGATDAFMMLGWIGAAMIGGALDWRPMVWITGDRSTGKSTLHKLVEMLIGKSGLVAASDATAAGLWQKIGHSSLPIAIDELEADVDNRRAQSVIKLARQAASGGVVLRGGADHHGSEFTARSCFMFSSILVPPLMSQDRSRMAILDLDRLSGTTPPSLKPRDLAALGAALRRRLADGWPRFMTTMETYRQQLAVAGHDARGCDQFGTLLACADLMLHDHPPDSETLADWGERLKVAKGWSEEDHEKCVTHLMTTVLDVYRDGRRRTVGDWVCQAAGVKGFAAGGVDELDANKVLQTFGLKVVSEMGVKRLAVANSHEGLSRLFVGSRWADGVWVQALRRVSGAEPRDSLRFAGFKVRCTVIPAAAVTGAEDDGDGAPGDPVAPGDPGIPGMPDPDDPEDGGFV